MRELYNLQQEICHDRQVRYANSDGIEDDVPEGTKASNPPCYEDQQDQPDDWVDRISHF